MSEPPPISLAWCQPQDIPLVGEMLERHWRSGHIMARDPGLYAWQFRHPGRQGGLSALLARRGQELVGHLGLVPGDFNLRGRRLPAAWTSLWLVTPQGHATGAGVALLRKAQEEAGSLVGCLGFNQQAQRLFAATGFHLLPRLPRWLRLGRAASLQSLLAGSPQPYPPELIRRLAEAAQAAPGPADPDLEVVDWRAPDDAAWDQAWNQTLAPGGLGAWLDAAFLRWRYLEHPIFPYRVRLARQGARVLGLMVYRWQALAGRSERVLRLLELLGPAAAQHALLQDLAREAQAPETAFWDFHCASREVAPALTQAGFVREDELPAMLPSLFQPLDYRWEPLPAALWRDRREGGAEEILDSPDLYLTRGQGDQDRPN